MSQTDEAGTRGPFQPELECPVCGSRDIRPGCPYEDCSFCPDIEAFSCNSCGAPLGRHRPLEPTEDKSQTDQVSTREFLGFLWYLVRRGARFCWRFVTLQAGQGTRV